ADGGAIFNHDGGQAVIRDSTIEDNQAIGGDGNHSTAPLAFAGAGLGGAIGSRNFAASRTNHLTIIRSAIPDNEALGGSGNSASGNMPFAGTGLGGGVANYVGVTTDVTSTAMSHNRAVGGTGNAISGGLVPAGLGAGGSIFNALGNFDFAGVTL